ncbi:MAG: type VI secretion lipoprotein TssJ [Desulfovibrionaceae bacterium]|nr:type VI secretion lipoprotein TssJ [Desulfovibrionaceae bacterium]
MHYSVRFFLIPLLVIFLYLVGCGGKTQQPLPPPPLPTTDPAQVTWNQEAGGLHYRIETASDLNHEGNIPLGITVCVYQLEDPTTFQDLATSKLGLYKLLDCNIETTKARSSKLFKMQPGKRVNVVADRVEKAKFFAVAAGYEHLSPELCTAIIPFPLHHDKQGVIFRDDVYQAAPMNALIHLGADAVTISGVERVQ